ncbi:DUF2635 domain-containing protein [Aeromonas veronii]|uniref:DUF2635 domain-containing protein n=1 Tax=Aeromonas veronii TaxID=654 RepID=UPI003F7A721B
MPDVVNDRKTVRAAAGRRVRKPDGYLLDEQGESVVWSSFWLRRHRDGDVEVVADAEPEAAEPQSDATVVKAVKGKESA